MSAESSDQTIVRFGTKGCTPFLFSALTSQHFAVPSPLGGCGYQFRVEGAGPTIGGAAATSSPTSPPPRLVVRTLENKTFEPNLEIRYTDYLRHEFSSGSGAQIVPDSEAADLVLSGQILSVSVPTLSFSQTTTLESRAEVFVMVQVEEMQDETSRVGANVERRVRVLRDVRSAIQPRPAKPRLGAGRPFHCRGLGFPLSAPVGIGEAGKAGCCVQHRTTRTPTSNKSDIHYGLNHLSRPT